MRGAGARFAGDNGPTLDRHWTDTQPIQRWGHSDQPPAWLACGMCPASPGGDAGGKPQGAAMGLCLPLAPRRGQR